MASKLFRDEAIQHQRERFFGEVLVISPPKLSLLAVVGAAAVSFLLLLFIFGEFARVVTVGGSLISREGAPGVYASSVGTLIQLMVAEGHEVAAGAPIARISLDMQTPTSVGIHAGRVNELANKKKLLEEQIATHRRLSKLKASDLRRRIIGLQAESINITEEIRVTESRVQTFEKVERYFFLQVQKGFVSDAHYQPKLGELRQQQALQQALKRRALEIEREIAGNQYQLEQSALESEILRKGHMREISETEILLLSADAQRAVQLTAPIAGKVTGVQVVAGQVVTPAMRLLTIFPQDAQLEARMYLPAKSIAFVKEGSKVKLRLAGYSVQRYGVVTGQVTSVSAVSYSTMELPQDAKIEGAAYLVTAKLDTQTVGNGPDAVRVSAGMIFNGEIVTGRRKIYEWMLDPLERIWARST